MKRNKLHVILAVLLFAITSFCLLVPTYAMPSMRDGVVTDQDGIIEGDTPDITLPKVTLPENGGNNTQNGNGMGNGTGDIMTPEGANGNTTTSTNSPVTSSPVTSSTTTTRAPSSSMTDEAEGRGIAIWGVVLAVVIAAAVVAIVFFTIPKKK